MSEWGKFLAPITISSSSNDFTLTISGPVNHKIELTAATYATILHLAAHIQATIRAKDAALNTSTVTVSSVGVMTISVSPGTLTSVTWDETALRDILGYSGAESVSASAITAADPHDEGWYPGVISYGSARGEGLADDSTWEPLDSSISTLAGDGTQTTIAPERLEYRRSLRFFAIHKDELNHATRGAKRFMDKWRALQFYWYPDREDGIVGTYGTQGDPGPTTYHDDKALDAAGSYYWLVTQTSHPRFQRNPSHPDWFIFELFLNAEPD